MSMSYLDKLGPIKARYDELSALMAEGGIGGDVYVKLSREFAELEPVVQTLQSYEAALKEQDDLEALLDDPEMGDMAKDDLKAVKERIPLLEQAIRLALIPKDETDTRNAILEIRAGTGGDEAALFAADLFAMYKGYAAHRGWAMQVVSMHESDLGGYKEIIAEIQGTDVFGTLKFESGAHRVQRVP
jgi:peptide chain release factor 1